MEDKKFKCPFCGGYITIVTCKKCGKQDWYCNDCHQGTGHCCSPTQIQDKDGDIKISTEIIKEHPIFIPVENKITKILCVEDGSVNIEEVKNMCTYAKIFLLVYKKGSKPPFILDAGE